HAGNGKHFFLRNRWCGLVMELRDGVADPGTEVVTAYRSPNASMADHQLFYEDEQTGTIRSALNGYCIDVQDDIVVVNPYDPYSKNQQWRKFGKKVQNRSKLSLVLQRQSANTERSEGQRAISEYWRSEVRREQRTGEQAHPSLSDSNYLEGTELLHFLLETQAAPHPCF
ncbi:hypothetical protein CAPTEDRAFT_198282, partial [Capitella teleta]